MEERGKWREKKSPSQKTTLKQNIIEHVVVEFGILGKRWKNTSKSTQTAEGIETTMMHCQPKYLEL